MLGQFLVLSLLETACALSRKSILKLGFKHPSQRLKVFPFSSFQIHIGHHRRCDHYFMEFSFSIWCFFKYLYHASVACKLSCFSGVLFLGVFIVCSPCCRLIVSAYMTYTRAFCDCWCIFLWERGLLEWI